MQNYFTHFVNKNAYPNGGPTDSDVTTRGDTTVSGGLRVDAQQLRSERRAVLVPRAGCNSVFCDGSVHFLSDSMSPTAMRALITPNEGINVPAGEFPK